MAGYLFIKITSTFLKKRDSRIQLLITVDSMETIIK
jgi:hypothetical protein